MFGWGYSLVIQSLSCLYEIQGLMHNNKEKMKENKEWEIDKAVLKKSNLFSVNKQVCMCIKCQHFMDLENKHQLRFSITKQIQKWI